MEVPAVPLETQTPAARPGGQGEAADKGFASLLLGSAQEPQDQVDHDTLAALEGLIVTGTPQSESTAGTATPEALLQLFSAAIATTPSETAQKATIHPNSVAGQSAAPIEGGSEPSLDQSSAPVAPPAEGEGKFSASKIQEIARRYPHVLLLDKPVTGKPGAPTANSIPAEGRVSLPELSPRQRQTVSTEKAPPSIGSEPARTSPEAATSNPSDLGALRRAVLHKSHSDAVPERASTPLPSTMGTEGASAASPRAGGFEAALESSRSQQAATPSRPADQVALRIHHAVQAGQDRIQFRLHPAELGRIEVRLDLSEDGPLRVAVLVERGEALELLQRDSRALERALQDAGLKTDQSSLSFDLREQNHGRAREDKGADDGLSDQDQSDELALSGNSSSAAAGEYLRDGLLDITI